VGDGGSIAKTVQGFCKHLGPVLVVVHDEDSSEPPFGSLSKRRGTFTLCGTCLGQGQAHSECAAVSQALARR
jgi:hypothetical protein